MSMINTEDTLGRHTRARAEVTDWTQTCKKNLEVKREEKSAEVKLVLYNLLWRERKKNLNFRFLVQIVSEAQKRVGN